MARKKTGLTRRKTIMLDINNKYRLKMLQSKLIEITGNTISFSYVIQTMLQGAL